MKEKKKGLSAREGVKYYNTESINTFLILIVTKEKKKVYILNL